MATVTDETPSAPTDPVARVAELEARIHEYHRTELERWAEATMASQDIFDQLQEIRQTLSWRVTAPLRLVRRRQLER